MATDKSGKPLEVGDNVQAIGKRMNSYSIANGEGNEPVNVDQPEMVSTPLNGKVTEIDEANGEVSVRFVRTDYDVKINPAVLQRLD